MSKTTAPPYELAPKIVYYNDLIDVSKLTISTLTSNPTSSSKRVIVTTTNDDDDSSTYSNSNISKGSVNRYIKEYPKID